ncbi:hypothetical protein [Rhodopirellula bahusiensis]|uniref:hypothetical protein n=1 Tax=Rhodopirellula bahusiensis TaxID=2014065 RepID=UPI003266A9A6
MIHSHSVHGQRSALLKNEHPAIGQHEFRVSPDIVAEPLCEAIMVAWIMKHLAPPIATSDDLVELDVGRPGKPNLLARKELHDDAAPLSNTDYKACPRRSIRREQY